MSKTSPNQPRSMEQLLQDLKEHDWSVNWKTADALAEMGKSAVPQLLKALESEDGYVRNGAAIALGKIRNKDATQPLLKALWWRDARSYEDDEDQEARSSAATAIGKLRDHTACAPLLAVLETILKTDLTLASYIVEALGEIGNPQAIPMLGRLVEHGNPEIQNIASYALAQMGTEGIEILLRIAPDRARLGRHCAVRALGTSRIESAFPILIEILKNRSDDKLVRNHAAQALGRIGKSPEILPLLLSVLETPDDEARSSALIGLGFLRDPLAYQAIVKHLEDIDLRYIAVMALGELGDVRACERLILLLKGDDSSLSFHAATALGKLGCSNALPALIELRDRNQKTDDPILQVQKTAVEAAIKMLQGKQAR